MKKKLFFFVPVSFAALAVLGGCRVLHFHDQSSPYYHDESGHWQVCTKCGEKFNEDKHSIDGFNDCNICGYHDPICIVNEDKIMTRLTEYGKNYTGILKKEKNYEEKYINDFYKVEYIGDYAFKDCKASKVIIPVECEGFYEHAFDGLTREQVTTEEEEEKGEPAPEWVLVDGVYYKANVFEKCQAMVNGDLYLTLKEAIESVTSEDTTVTILRDLDLKNTEPIEVKHRITLEPFEGEVNLKNTKFKISSSATLKILSSVHYISGTTELYASPIKEQYGSTMSDCYTCGSLVYHKLTSKPYEGVSVHYVNPDLPTPTTSTIAKGTHQVYRDALIIDTDCFAYGVFKFNGNYSTIMGLTDFGATINKLTIAPLLEAGDSVEIFKDCFHRHGEESLEISILGQKKSIKVRGEFQKGSFRHVIIDKGVYKVGSGAFVTSFEEGRMDPVLREAIAVVACPLQTLVMSNDVAQIGPEAFKSCGSLGSVVIGNPDEGEGSSLEYIGTNAFKDCFNLTSVDFHSANKIQEIFEGAFSGCQKLAEVQMPKDGWFTDKGHGFPESEMEPGQAAYKLANSYNNEFWQRSIREAGNKCYAFKPRERDAQGYHNKTVYFDSIEDFLNPVPGVDRNNVCFQITSRYPEGSRTKNDLKIPKDRSMYLDCDKDVNFKINNLIVEAGAFIFIGDNITLTGNVKLEHNDETGETGGIAFFDREKPQSLDIQFTPINIHAKQSTSKVYNYRTNRLETCVSYGVCNFKYNVSNDTEENLISVSNLGKEMTELEVNDQLAFSNPKDLYIGNHFAAGDETLHAITFGKTVKSINVEGGPASDSNKEAFHSCIYLTDIYFEEGSIIETIGRGAFYNCINLANVDLPNCTKLQHIGDNCFQNCDKLESVKLYSPDLIYIGKIAFRGTRLDYFDVGPNKTGWKPEGSGEIDLSNPENAAHLFRDKPYNEKVWWRR